MFQVSFLVVPLCQPSLGAAPATGKAQPGCCGLPVRGLGQGNGIITILQLLIYARFPKDCGSGKQSGRSHFQRLESCTVVR